MTAPTVPFTEFAAKAQEQVSAAVRTWADALQSATDDLTAERPAVVDPKVVIEKYFDFAQQVLDKQRELANSVLATSSEATRSVTEQAAAATKTVAAQTVSAVETTTEQAAAAVKAATAKN
jgi:hypothetical protein